MRSFLIFSRLPDDINNMYYNIVVFDDIKNKHDLEKNNLILAEYTFCSNPMG